MIDRVDLPNIYNENKLHKDSVEALYEVLDELNPYSLDIYNIFKRPNDNITENIIKIYAESLYYGMQKALTNPVVIQRMKEKIGTTDNYQPFDIKEFYKKLLKDYFVNFTSFKEKKGLDVAIEYAYNIIFTSGLQPGLDVNGSSGFNLKWGTEDDPNEPFFIRIEGLLDPILYEGSVKSIAHPVGFGYNYVISLVLEFIEYIDDLINFNVKTLEIVSTNYRKEFDKDKVEDIYTSKNIQNQERIVITFNDGKQLIKDFNGSITYNEKDGSVIENWNNTYILKLDYDISLKFRLKDEFDNSENNLIVYDCVWNRLNSFDTPIIGEAIVNKFRVADKYYSSLVIGKIDDNTIYTLPDDPIKYTPDKMPLFLTNAINRGLFEHIHDDIDLYSTNNFTDNVINEKGISNTVGNKIIVGSFKVGSQSENPEGGVILDDSFSIEREMIPTEYSETVTKNLKTNFYTTILDNFDEKVVNDDIKITVGSFKVGNINIGAEYIDNGVILDDAFDINILKIRKNNGRIN